MSSRRLRRHCALAVLALALSPLLRAEAPVPPAELSEKGLKDVKPEQDRWYLFLANDVSIGYAHDLVKTGTSAGGPVTLVQREYAMIDAEAGAARTATEEWFWDKDLAPLQAAYVETRPDGTRVASAVRFPKGEIVIRESVGGAAPAETKLPAPERLLPDEEVLVLLRDVSKAEALKFQSLSIEKKQVTDITLSAKGESELDLGENGKRKVIRLESSREKGIVFFLDPGDGHVVRGEMKETPVVVIASNPAAPKAFYASAPMTQALVGRARAAWKEAGTRMENAVIGLSLPVGGANWKAGEVQNRSILGRAHNPTGAYLSVSVESVGPAWTLKEYAEAHVAGIKANEKLKNVRQESTQLGGQPAVRIQYDVPVQGATVPVLMYLSVNRGAAIQIVWGLEPTKAQDCANVFSGILRGAKVTK